MYCKTKDCPKRYLSSFSIKFGQFEMFTYCLSVKLKALL